MPQEKLTKKDLLLEAELTRYGHTLGLAIEHQVSSTSNIINSEGNYLPLSMTILSDLVTLYTQEYPDPAFEQISTLLKQQTALEMATVAYVNSIIDFNLFGVYRNLYRIYKRNTFNARELSHGGVCLIPFALENHGFYLAFNDQYIAISNRGKSSFSKLGTHIYKLVPGAIEQLQAQNFAEMKFSTIRECEEYFSQFAEAEPQISFEFKPQKIGHCSFANMKSMLKILHFMYGENNPKKVQQKYKHFTTWMREYEVKQLIAKYRTAKNQGDQDFVALYQNLIKAYIARHEANTSFAQKIIAGGQNLLMRGLFSFVGRSDIKVGESQETRLRRNNHIALIYNALKDDPNFKEIFAPLSEEVAQTKTEELVLAHEAAVLPKRSPLEVLRDEESAKQLPAQQLFVLSFALLLAPVLLIVAAITNIVKRIFSGSESTPQLYVEKQDNPQFADTQDHMKKPSIGEKVLNRKHANIVISDVQSHKQPKDSPTSNPGPKNKPDL